jgi:integrase
MRRGEVLALGWRDVDLERRVLRVQQSRSRGETGMVYCAPKTAKGRRSISLDPVTADLLRQHRQAQQTDREMLGAGYRDDDLVFCREDGTPHHSDGITGSFVRLARQAGLPPIPLHEQRHTHATLALSAGIHPRVVQERLGHASIQMTLDTYSHAVPAMQVDAADRIAALVDCPGRQERRPSKAARHMARVRGR